jgi:hypothetical protein
MIKNRKQFSAWVIGLLALSLAGCSEAEVPSATTPGDDPLVNDPMRREIILGFQNKLNIKTAGTTRADAPSPRPKRMKSLHWIFTCSLRTRRKGHTLIRNGSVTVRTVLRYLTLRKLY